MSLSDFKIITKLGSGAYSSVYKVQRILDHEIYALKKVNLSGLSQKQKQNSLNQIRILASIRNEHIIGYREAFFDQNTKSLCIVMEYAANGDLYQKVNQKIQENSVFSENQVWSVFVQIVRGLRVLHNKKILHRDLKSANVFLTQSEKVKLGDMNVSKITQKGLCQTQTGTPYYASPEVWKDEPYGPKSDIWSLGCVMYEMMALKPPFQAQDIQSLYKKITKGDYPKLPLRYSSDLNDLIRILLQTDPFKRPSCGTYVNNQDKILSMKMITKRFRDGQDEKMAYENPEFLQTIRMPKNIYILTENLPKPNYFDSKKQISVEKIKIAQNKADKSKKITDSLNNKLFPKLINKQLNPHNKSLILKNTSVVEAARMEVEDSQVINIIRRDQIKAREQKARRQRTNANINPELSTLQTKDRKSTNLQEKISQIQKIYGQQSRKK